ncbi:unnamed protein product [Urochloa humidicola]
MMPSPYRCPRLTDALTPSKPSDMWGLSNKAHWLPLPSRRRTPPLPYRLVHPDPQGSAPPSADCSSVWCHTKWTPRGGTSGGGDREGDGRPKRSHRLLWARRVMPLPGAPPRPARASFAVCRKEGPHKDARREAQGRRPRPESAPTRQLPAAAVIVRGGGAQVPRGQEEVAVRGPSVIAGSGRRRGRGSGRRVGKRDRDRGPPASRERGPLELAPGAARHRSR